MRSLSQETVWFSRRALYRTAEMLEGKDRLAAASESGSAIPPAISPRGALAEGDEPTASPIRGTREKPAEAIDAGDVRAADRHVELEPTGRRRTPRTINRSFGWPAITCASSSRELQKSAATGRRPAHRRARCRIPGRRASRQSGRHGRRCHFSSWLGGQRLGWRS